MSSLFYWIDERTCEYRFFFVVVEMGALKPRVVLMDRHFYMCSSAWWFSVCSLKHTKRYTHELQLFGVSPKRERLPIPIHVATHYLSEVDRCDTRLA